MGFYEEQVLPRITNVLLGNRAMGKLRARAPDLVQPHLTYRVAAALETFVEVKGCFGDIVHRSHSPCTPTSDGQSRVFTVRCGAGRG